jgi:hypothetical protein
MAIRNMEDGALEVWEHRGIRCVMRVSPLIGLNGYARIPPEVMPKDTDDVVTAHWGISYGPDEDGWVGFDTGHSGDWWAPDDVAGWMDDFHMQIAQRMWNRAKQLPWGRRWTREKVREHTEQIADQIAVQIAAWEALKDVTADTEERTENR